jgi:hypothetical protein
VPVCQKIVVQNNDMTKKVRDDEKSAVVGVVAGLKKLRSAPKMSSWTTEEIQR